MPLLARDLAPVFASNWFWPLYVALLFFFAAEGKAHCEFSCTMKCLITTENMTAVIDTLVKLANYHVAGFVPFVLACQVRYWLGMWLP